MQALQLYVLQLEAERDAAYNRYLLSLRLEEKHIWSGPIAHVYLYGRQSYDMRSAKSAEYQRIWENAWDAWFLATTQLEEVR